MQGNLHPSSEGFPLTLLFESIYSNWPKINHQTDRNFTLLQDH
jgi:hypothetical protein